MAASSLLSNVNSEAQHQANILTNTPNRIKVMVEDEVDIVVWHKILKKAAPHLEFEIGPYSYDSTVNGKGKSNVLKFADRFKKNFIGCVDSDFDWLLQDWTQDGDVIRNNAYILQTYAYSIENLASQPYGDSDCMLECVMHSCELQVNLDADYSTFIVALSAAVYDILIWHLLMWKNQIEEDKISDGWKYIFGNDHYSDILKDSTLSIEAKRNAILNRFEEKAKDLRNQYEGEYPNLIGDKAALEAELRSTYGIQPDNAYLFVRGHNLHDFLMHCFFNPVRSHLIKLHQDEIKAHNEEQEIQNLMNHYKKHLKQFDRDHIHKVAYLNDDTNPFTKAIINDIQNIFL